MSRTHTFRFTVPGLRDKILAGKKWQTLRFPRRRPIRVGDELVLKDWRGKPMRKGSRTQEFARVPCTEIAGPFVVRLDCEPARVFCRDEDDLSLKGMSPSQHKEIARADGFDSWDALVSILRGFYGRRAVEMVGPRWDPLTRGGE